MTPRKASLRVAHQRTCPLANLTSIETAAKGYRFEAKIKRSPGDLEADWAFIMEQGDKILSGDHVDVARLERISRDIKRVGETEDGAVCKCKPSYYVMWRDTSGKTKKSTRVTNKEIATQFLHQKQVEIQTGAIGLEATRRTKTFPEWTAEYVVWLTDERRAKASTVTSYKTTLEIAKDEIGHVQVRAIGYPELQRFYRRIKGLAVATQLRHFRELSACLSQAMVAGYAESNPVPTYRKSLSLGRAPSGVPPFSAGEIASTLTALEKEDSVYPAIVKAILATGLRIGEAIALDWTDLNEAQGKLHVRHNFDQATGELTTPKDGEARTVFLTEAALEAFAGWTRIVGSHTSGPIFTMPTGGRVIEDWARRRLNDALKTAGVPKINPDISERPRKPFHSLRATFSSQMQQEGRNPVWIQQQLGHSDLSLTLIDYGKWTDEQQRAEAQKESTNVRLDSHL